MIQKCCNIDKIAGKQFMYSKAQKPLVLIKVWDKSGLSIMLPKQPVGWSLVVKCSRCCGSCVGCSAAWEPPLTSFIHFIRALVIPRVPSASLHSPLSPVPKPLSPWPAWGQWQVLWEAAATQPLTNLLALVTSLVAAPTPAEDLMKCWYEILWKQDVALTVGQSYELCWFRYNCVLFKQGTSPKKKNLAFFSYGGSFILKAKSVFLYPPSCLVLKGCLNWTLDIIVCLWSDIREGEGKRKMLTSASDKTNRSISEKLPCF